jgi:hypothetical protein
MHDTETDVIVGGDPTVMDAVPDFDESCVEVAFTFAIPELRGVAGGVYMPEPEIVPESADHVTAEL